MSATIRVRAHRRPIDAYDGSTPVDCLIARTGGDAVAECYQDQALTWACAVVAESVEHDGLEALAIADLLEMRND